MDLRGLRALLCCAAALLPPGAAEETCPCSEIPELALARPPRLDCVGARARFRYSCSEGYVRRAGTSNLITCREEGGVRRWTNATSESLQCIPAPKFAGAPAAATDAQKVKTVSSTPSPGLQPTWRATANQEPAFSVATVSAAPRLGGDAVTASAPFSAPNNGTSGAATVARTVAISVSVLFVLFLLVIGLFLFWRRSRRRNHVPAEESELEPMQSSS